MYKVLSTTPMKWIDGNVDLSFNDRSGWSNEASR